MVARRRSGFRGSPAFVSGTRTSDPAVRYYRKGLQRVKYKLVGIIIVYLLLSASQVARAQSETPRFEIGIQFTALRLREFRILDARTKSGFGGRFTYNITNKIAVEAEGNYFGNDDYFGDHRLTQGLFGVKAGVRRRRVGMFGKARPGFLRFKDRLVCGIPEGCPSVPSPPFFISYAFAFDLGGVVEFYPSRRISIRTDIGDTIVRFDRGALFINGQPHPVHFTSHNVQFSTGISFRF